MAIETLRSLLLSSGHPDALETRTWQPQSIANLDQWTDQAFFGGPSLTGRFVTQRNSLQVSTVWACVDRRACDMARMPLETFQRVSGGNDLAPRHYLWSLLQQEANPEMPSFIWKHLMQVYLDLWGNAYCEMQDNGRGQIVALWPWRPDRTTVWRDKSRRLMYTYHMEDGKDVSISHEHMFHLRGLSLDGVMGLSPIDELRQTLGLSLAMTEHEARFFSNGARPLGIIKLAKALTNEDAIKRLRDKWEGAHRGLDNAHRIAILEEGADYAEAGTNMVDSQFKELKGVTDIDICKVFKMPPHKIGILDRATNNNIEHQGKEYVDSTLGPLAVNWEQQIEFAMLSERDRNPVNGYFVRYDFSELLRGDMKAQAEYLVSLANNRVMTSNEARKKISMNRMEGAMHDMLWSQLGFAPVQEGYPYTSTGQPLPQNTQPPTKKPNGVGALTQ